MTQGRRTGREHAVTLWFAYAEGLLWLRTDEGVGQRGPDWYRNLRAARRCRVEAGGFTLEGTVVPSFDRDADLRRLVELWRAKYGPVWVSDWYVERGRLPIKLRLRLTSESSGPFDGGRRADVR